MQILKQNTATVIHLGPAVDKTNGYTPITTLVATGGGAVDELSLYKHEATGLTDIRASTTFTHRAGGTYTVTLAAGDVNTLGRLRVTLRDDDQIRPLALDFLVVPANVFDSLAGSDLLQADMRELAGGSSSATNLRRGGEGLAIGAVTGAPTTTSVPTDLTAAVTGHYTGRVVTFTSGPLAGQTSEITGYDGSSKTLTVTALTSAPAVGNEFVIS